jgi:DNA-binding IclR family transcriptional regulator
MFHEETMSLEQSKVAEIKANRPALKALLTLYHPMYAGHHVHSGDLEDVCNLSRSTVWRILHYLWQKEMVEYDPKGKTSLARLTPTGARYARYFYEQLGSLTKYEKWTEDVSQSQQDGVLPSSKMQELKNELRDYLSFL